jgi:hypothetical protein
VTRDLPTKPRTDYPKYRHICSPVDLARSGFLGGSHQIHTVVRWTPGEVQRYMGHLDPRVTLAVYTHITAEDLPAQPAIVADG